MGNVILDLRGQQIGVVDANFATSFESRYCRHPAHAVVEVARRLQVPEYGIEAVSSDLTKVTARESDLDRIGEELKKTSKAGKESG